MNYHCDPSRPMREHEAAESSKRDPRPAPDTEAREQRLRYERELLQRNRRIDEQLDHALIESFPASDPLAVTPEGTFPVRDPTLADDPLDPPDEPDRSAASESAASPDAPAAAPRHAGQGARAGQLRPDPQTPAPLAERDAARTATPQRRHGTATGSRR